MASQLRVGVLGPVFVIIMVEQGKMREERLTLLCKVRHVDQGWGKVGGDQAGCDLGSRLGSFVPCHKAGKCGIIPFRIGQAELGRLSWLRV